MVKRKSTLEDQEKGVLYLYFTDWNSMDFWKPVYRSHESRDAAAWGSAFRHHAGCFWRYSMDMIFICVLVIPERNFFLYQAL